MVDTPLGRGKGISDIMMNVFDFTLNSYHVITNKDDNIQKYRFKELQMSSTVKQMYCYKAIVWQTVGRVKWVVEKMLISYDNLTLPKNRLKPALEHD